ncbi:hypothetical protein Syun_022877 [Stephania yunnanensis]|uniref:Uncharacterized protein n=1 Tax=Stephania yunnanensis TaxID=152371 RepID=A0AAP0F7W4_9MAGN
MRAVEDWRGVTASPASVADARLAVRETTRTGLLEGEAAQAVPRWRLASERRREWRPASARRRDLEGEADPDGGDWRVRGGEMVATGDLLWRERHMVETARWWRLEGEADGETMSEMVATGGRGRWWRRRDGGRGKWTMSEMVATGGRGKWWRRRDGGRGRW